MQDSRPANGDRLLVIELRGSSLFGFRGSLGSQGDRDGQRSGRIQIRAEMQFIFAGHERSRGCSQRISIRSQLQYGGSRGRREDSQIDGKRFARENGFRHTDGFEPQRALRASRERESIDRDAELAGLPRRPGDAAARFVTVGDERDARNSSRGQGGNRVAHGGFEIGGAPGFSTRRLKRKRRSPLGLRERTRYAREGDHAHPLIPARRVDARGKLGSPLKIGGRNAGRGID